MGTAHGGRERFVLPSKLKAGLRLVRSVAACVLASSGFRPDKVGRYTLATAALAGAGYAAHQSFIVGAPASVQGARVYAYFVLLFATRYAYLFLSFIPGGIADRLVRSLGEERGYSVYEVGTGWMFFQRGLSFAPLVALHPWSLVDAVGIHGGARPIAQSICVASGALLLAVGFLVNTSAMMVVGFDVYYYKDLFLRRALGAFEVRGPYRWFSNPMYGLGQCSGYGAALMVGSIDGLVATLVNQLSMYLFFALVEKPHIAAVFGEGAPAASATPAFESPAAARLARSR